MTIGGVVLGVFLTIVILGGALAICAYQECNPIKGIIIGLIVSVIIWVGLGWYYNNTASGKRAVVDQQAELNNGLERVINVYTANGDLIATYEGKIDLEDNEGGYVIFDYEGKRYTYYNCFVESIADIN